MYSTFTLLECMRSLLGNTTAERRLTQMANIKFAVSHDPVILEENPNPKSIDDIRF